MSAFEPTGQVLDAMLAKADERLSTARRDFAAAAFGDAASRAYYAVFHAISALLVTRGLTFSSHSQTIGGFNREFVKTGVFPPDTSRKLQRLFQDRPTADYDWYHHIEEADAGVAVSDAASIVSHCKQQVANWKREHRREDSR